MFGPQTVLFDLQRVLKYVTPVANISNVWGFHTDAGFPASLEKNGRPANVESPIPTW